MNLTGVMRGCFAKLRGNEVAWRALRSRRKSRALGPKRGQNTPQNVDGRWRTSGDRDVDGQKFRERPAHGIAIPEHAARTRAFAGGDNQFWMGRRLVSPPYRFLHVERERTGDEQHVRMTRARDEADAQALDVVVRIVERVDFEFASVAGARIDLADAQRPAEHVEDVLLDPPAFGVPCVVAFRNAQRRRAGSRNLFDELPHYRSCPA